MSRDFILILGGGLVSLITTIVVLFVSDYVYRRDELLYRKSLPPPPLYARTEENYAEEMPVIIPEEESPKTGPVSEPVPGLAATQLQSEE